MRKRRRWTGERLPKVTGIDLIILSELYGGSGTSRTIGQWFRRIEIKVSDWYLAWRLLVLDVRGLVTHNGSKHKGAPVFVLTLRGEEVTDFFWETMN